MNFILNNCNRRFVAMPDFLKLEGKNLKYLDALTYASIRSFRNSKNGLCHPSYEKIIERSGLSRAFIAGSIKRLEDIGLFSVVHSKRKGTCNKYSFAKIERFERIPYELFDSTDLSIHEKSMLLCLRHFFNHGSLSSLYDITTFATYLGLSYKTVYTQFRSLTEKGYISEVIITRRFSDKTFKKYFLTSKINWLYDYEVRPVVVGFVKLKVA